MANGEKMVTDARCEALKYSLQGEEFVDDLKKDGWFIYFGMGF